MVKKPIAPSWSSRAGHAGTLNRHRHGLSLATRWRALNWLRAILLKICVSVWNSPNKAWAPVTVMKALVYSYFPTSEAAERTQRERWEHGHLGIFKTILLHACLKGLLPGPALKRWEWRWI